MLREHVYMGHSTCVVSGRKSVSTVVSKHSNVIATSAVFPPTTTVSAPKTATTEIKIEKADLSRKKKDYVSSPIYERTVRLEAALVILFGSSARLLDVFLCVRPQEVDYSEHITINVQIPDDLRLLLIYDFELICGRKKVAFSVLRSLCTIF